MEEKLVTRAASHFGMNTAGLPMFAQERLGNLQGALVGAKPEARGSGRTPLGLSCLYKWMEMGRRVNGPGAPGCISLCHCQMEVSALPSLQPTTCE